MGLFNKSRKDGATFDGQGDQRRGLIDVIRFNGLEDELVWKFPFDNISTGAQLVVNQSQEAVFIKGGEVADIFGPGTKTLSANNIPILQKLVNLPFGGNTPFTAEVWYVSKTARRNLKFGTPEPVLLRDPMYAQATVPVRANGEYGIRIVDSAAFLKNMVGTLHLISTRDIIAQFRSDIVSALKECLARYIAINKVSVLDITAHISQVSREVATAINDEFLRYGIEVTNLKVMNIDFDRNDPHVQMVLDAQARQSQREIEHYTYQQERQFDILEGAATNEGNSAQVMGAGIGMGMGVGLGATFSQHIGAMAGNSMAGAPVGQAAPPPPPPAPAAFHVLVSGQQYGPYDQATMQQMAAARQIDANTYVWRPGMPQWLPASQCPELAGLFMPQPPAFPPQHP